MAALAAGGELPRAPESTAFVQDPRRPNTVHGVVGEVEGAPEVGLKDGRDITVNGVKVSALGPALLQAKPATSAGRVAFAIDRDAPWSTVRPLLDAAAKAGHAHASFLTRVVVENVSRPSHLDIEVAIEKRKPTSDRELHVSVSARGAVMMKWMEGPKQIGDVVSGDAAVTRSRRSSNAAGTRRTSITTPPTSASIRSSFTSTQRLRTSSSSPCSTRSAQRSATTRRRSS